MKKLISLLLLLVLSFSFADASKILLLDKISSTKLVFDRSNSPIINNNSHFFIAFDPIEYKSNVYDYQFKKNKRLSKNLQHYIKGNYNIIGINKNLLILLNTKSNLEIPSKDGTIEAVDRFKIKVVNLVKNKVIFTKTIRIPDGIKSYIEDKDYYSVKNKNYLLLCSGTTSEPNKLSLYYLFFTNKGSYKIKKVAEKTGEGYKNISFINAKFGVPGDNSIYFDHYKYDINTNKLLKLHNFKYNIKEGFVTPLSKDILLYNDGDMTKGDKYKLGAYNQITQSNFTFFDSSTDINNKADYSEGRGDGNGDIFIKYMHFPCDNCNPINKVYMLDAKNKVLMGDGFLQQTSMNFAPQFLQKHLEIKRGVYSYIIGNGKMHKLYHYLLVDTKRLRDYKYIKPSMLRNFHRIAPSLKLKNPKIILTSNNVFIDKSFYNEEGEIISYKIPYMIKDDNKLYVLIHGSFFNSQSDNAYSNFNSTIKLKLKNTILKTDNFYPKDKLYKINYDKDEPGFTRVVVFDLPKGFKLKKGDVVSVGEALHPKGGAIQVLNFKIGKMF